MGAVTALLYAAKHDTKEKQVSCLILDSPFSNLVKMVPEVADKIDVRSSPRHYWYPRVANIQNHR